MKICIFTILFSLLVAWASGETSESVSGNHIFTASAYKEAVKTGEENILISPISVQTVLALAQSGARDDTAKEIRSTLHLPNTDEKTRASFKTVLQNLKSGENYSLHTANKIYVGNNFAIKNDFKSVAKNDYLSEIESIDFSKSAEAAETINQWVEEQTNHKIQNLVDSNSVNGGTPAILINALYFKSRWIHNDFHKYPKLKRDFYKSATDVVKVDTMTDLGGRYDYYEDSELDAAFLALPFKADDAYFIIALPNRKEGLADLEKQAEKVFSKHQFKGEIVDVVIPLFKIETTIDFKKILQELGIRKAFKTGEADFSGIAGNKGELAVQGVLQKTFINVNEDGVEAAAATNLWFFTSGPPRARKHFTVDHPFIFYVQVKDVILFAGRVKFPKY